MFVAVFLSASVSSAQQPVASAPSQATVEHRDGATIHVTSNSNFEYVHLFKPNTQSYDNLLLQVTQRNEMNFDAEGVKGSIRVRAWRMRGDKRAEALWTFNSAGNEGAVFANMGLYQTIRWPCCSAMWVYEYFSLTNGAHLYISNGGAANNEGVRDNSLLAVTGHTYKDTRFVAFGAGYANGHEKPALQYGTDSMIKQRIELRGHEYGDNFDVPDMSLVDDNGGKVTDLAGALNFTIVLRFKEADDQPAAELRIPVMDDVVIPQKAVLPKGYSLVELLP